MNRSTNGVGSLLLDWVGQRNRRDKGAGTRQHDMWVSRTEGSLAVTAQTTFHYDGENRLDAIGTHTIATLDGTTVFEEAGGETKVFEPGDWLTAISR